MRGNPYSEKTIVRCKDTGEECTGNKYLQTKHWEQLRRKIMSDRCMECERCHKPLTNATAVIHHNTYKRFGNEKDEDLNLLCDRCHSIIHKSKKQQHEDNKTIMEIYRRLSKSERQMLIEYALKLIDKR